MTIEQFIDDVIGSVIVAGGSPNIGDWVEDLHLLAQRLQELGVKL